MKSLFVIRSGGAVNWVLRVAAALLGVCLVLWIPTNASNGLMGSCTEALTLMSAAMALFPLPCAL